MSSFGGARRPRNPIFHPSLSWIKRQLQRLPATPNCRSDVWKGQPDLDTPQKPHVSRRKRWVCKPSWKGVPKIQIRGDSKIHSQLKLGRSPTRVPSLLLAKNLNRKLKQVHCIGTGLLATENIIKKLLIAEFQREHHSQGQGYPQEAARPSFDVASRPLANLPRLDLSNSSKWNL